MASAAQLLVSPEVQEVLGADLLRELRQEDLTGTPCLVCGADALRDGSANVVVASPSDEPTLIAVHLAHLGCHRSTVLTSRGASATLTPMTLPGNEPASCAVITALDDDPVWDDALRTSGFEPCEGGRRSAAAPGWRATYVDGHLDITHPDRPALWAGPCEAPQDWVRAASAAEELLVVFRSSRSRSTTALAAKVAFTVT